MFGQSSPSWDKLPNFSERTLLIISAPPYLEKKIKNMMKKISKPQIDFSFDFHSDISIEQVMQSNSTNRKSIIKEQDEHRRKY